MTCLSFCPFNKLKKIIKVHKWSGKSYKTIMHTKKEKRIAFHKKSDKTWAHYISIFVAFNLRCFGIWARENSGWNRPRKGGEKKRRKGSKQAFSDPKNNKQKPVYFRKSKLLSIFAKQALHQQSYFLSRRHQEGGQRKGKQCLPAPKNMASFVARHIAHIQVK